MVSPSERSDCSRVSTSLTWNPSVGASSYDVYLGTSNPPQFLTNVTTTNYAPASLLLHTLFLEGRRAERLHQQRVGDLVVYDFDSIFYRYSDTQSKRERNGYGQPFGYWRIIRRSAPKSV